jgi:hypothetical protein
MGVEAEEVCWLSPTKKAAMGWEDEATAAVAAAGGREK